MAVPPLIHSSTLFLLFFHLVAAAHAIGVNYGTLGDNLPPPEQVAQFLKSKTKIDRIKIFDVNPEILRAFTDTGILVAVTIPNGEIPSLTDKSYARQWISANIEPFYPRTKINYILVGNEILHWGPQNLRDNLVAAMRSVHEALVLAGIKDVKVTSAHSLGILERSDPPSLAKFRPGWDVGVLSPMLQFLHEVNSTFMVNPYPYFGYSPEHSDFALFRPNKGLFDPHSKRTYGNMFDLLIDAVFVSMKRLGYGDVDISVGETGWASAGEIYEQPKCSPENAAAYNGGLVRREEEGRGTPLRPRRKMEVYVFALFNENLKPGGVAEKNFGLFTPDFSSVYDVGLLRDGADHEPVQPIPTPSQGVKKLYCVPKPDASDNALQNNINYACGEGIDCSPIQPGGSCFTPNTVRDHASYVMNTYYQAKGRNDFDCNFSTSAMLTEEDPSYGACKYLS